jgi:MoaA/NifB/PqqE/SkfB family radical SAM enzyme
MSEIHLKTTPGYRVGAYRGDVSMSSHSELSCLGANLLGRSADALEASLSVERIQAMQLAQQYPTSFSQPLGFQLEVTSRCNLVCKHCYNTSGGDGSDEMSEAEWDGVVEQIAALRPFQVIISGGEPLLRGEWLFRTMDRLNHDPTRFVLITNGFLADTTRVERLCRYPYYWIQVSIDGAIPQAHDCFRGITGSWERAVRAAAEVAARGKALVVAHTVYPGNIDTLPDMVELAAVLGAVRIICDEAMRLC